MISAHAPAGGSYEVHECVGEGSFGRVYRGRRRFTGQVVALKYVPLAQKTREDVDALRREIAILSRLDNPYIVRLLDHFETRSHLVLVTEFCHGNLFEVLLEDGPLPEATVRRVGAQLVAALSYLADAGVMHRDLKPQNILIGARSCCKLADFGFARTLEQGDLASSVRGTPFYMSPELLLQRPYDAGSDVWALCVLLYELRAGVPPFNAPTFPALVEAIVSSDTASIAFPPETFSPQLRTFLQQGLVRDPRERATWAQLAAHPFLGDVVEE